MRGAIVFLAAFLLFFVITLGYNELPPGRQIYDALVDAETDYDVLGIPALDLIVAVFNGVIYGVIIWLVHTVLNKVMGSGKREIIELMPEEPEEPEKPEEPEPPEPEPEPEESTEAEDAK